MAKKSNPNFNRSIKVPESTIQGLRAGKTFEGNVAKFKASGMTAVQREAMNRFYGKNRVAKAFGSTDTSPAHSPMTGYKPTPHPKAFAPGAISKGGNGGGAVKTTSPQVRKSGNNSFAKSAGSFAANELFGVDDLKNTFSHLRHRQFTAAAKSVGEATFELGTTAAAVVGAIPTGGASLAADAARIAAKQAAKQGVKVATKQAAKATAKGAAKSTGKAVVSAGKSLATGSVRGGVKNVVKAPVAAYRGVKSAKTSFNAARAGMDKLAVDAAAKKAAHSAAQTSVKDAADAYARYTARKGTKASYNASTAAAKQRKLDAARAAEKSARLNASSAAAKVTARSAQVAAKKATKKAIRRGAGRAIVVQSTGKSYNKFK